MAEVTAFRNNVLDFPVYGLPYTVTFPMLDADGDLVTGATTPDSEISKNGDTFGDCTNEATEIATASGMYYLSLTGAELTADIAAIISKSATSGMKTTPLVLYPVKLPIILVADNAGAYDSATTINLGSGASATNDYYNGAIVYIYGGTGAEQVRMITDYVGSTKIATVHVAWATNPDTTSDLKVFATPLRPVLSAVLSGTVNANIVSQDNIDFSALQKASINAEVDAALNTAIPGSPTADSINERIVAIDAKLPTGTIAGAGEQMDLINAPNAAAVATIQSGLATEATALKPAKLGYVRDLICARQWSGVAANWAMSYSGNLGTDGSIAVAIVDADATAENFTNVALVGVLTASGFTKDAGFIGNASGDGLSITMTGNTGGITEGELTITGTDRLGVFTLIIPLFAVKVAGDIITYPCYDGSQMMDAGAGGTWSRMRQRVSSTKAALDIVDANVDAILVDTGTTLDAALAVVDANVDAILIDTGTTLDAALAVVDANVDAILIDTGSTLNDLTVAILEDTGTTLDTKINTLDTKVSALSNAAIADAVWDEALSGHVVAGSAGKALADAGTAADPWNTPLPGSYGAGTAGKKIGDMASEVSSVLLDTGTTLDAAIAAVKTDTAAILTDTGTTLDAAVAAVKADTTAILVDTGTTLDAALAVVDANVDAILIDTGTTLDAKIDAIVISAPTAAQVADAVWDEALAGHAIAGSTGIALAAAAAGLTSQVAGMGAVANVITVTVADLPKSGVDVWVTSDIAGVTVVAGTLTTDALGQVTFYLDPGTYYVWQQLTGFNFVCPDVLTVT